MFNYEKGKDESTSKFLGNGRGGAPKPPKRGEIIKCLVCGRPMPPSEFSTNPIIRKREFKWQCHDACMQNMFATCDKETPGLITERKGI